MPRNTQRFKRHQFFIKKEFQLNFIWKFCLLILAGGTLSTGLILYFSSGTLTSMFQQSRMVITDTAFTILPVVIYTNLITIVLISLATIFVTLFVSHKIAGPIFRFEKDIKTIANGDLTLTIYLRDGDQLIELAEGINTMTVSLNKKILDSQKGLEKIIESASKEGAPQWFLEELGSLHKRFDQNFKL